MALGARLTAALGHTGAEAAREARAEAMARLQEAVTKLELAKAAEQDLRMRLGLVTEESTGEAL